VYRCVSAAAAAPRWTDIDVDGATLSVRQQLQRVTGEGLQLVEPTIERSRRRRRATRT
jgi:hypothetical protein